LDQVIYIADRIIAETDADGDGVICFEEFKESLPELDIENKMAFLNFK
jgi:Ca2+-binding EF-hand superfamily protein